LFLDVVYDTRGKRGAEPRELKLYGNLPEGCARVVMAADVRPWISVLDVQRPARYPQGTSASGQLVIEGTTPQPFALTWQREAVPAGVELTLVPLDEGAQADPQGRVRSRRWRADLVFGPELPAGVHSWPIHLVSDVKNPDAAPEASEWLQYFGVSPLVSVEVLGKLSLTPPSLALGAFAQGTSLARTFRLECHDPGFHLGEPRARLEPLQVESAVHDLEGAYTIHVRKVQGSEAWDLELLVRGERLPAGSNLLARLVVETDHPQVPRLEASVTGTCLAPSDDRQLRAGPRPAPEGKPPEGKPR
jgi:hypothetical protein